MGQVARAQRLETAFAALVRGAVDDAECAARELKGKAAEAAAEAGNAAEPKQRPKWKQEAASCVFTADMQKLELLLPQVIGRADVGEALALARRRLAAGLSTDEILRRATLEGCD